MKKKEFKKLVRERLGKYFQAHGYSVSRREPVYSKMTADGVYHLVIFTFKAELMPEVWVAACVPEMFDDPEDRSFLDGSLGIACGGIIGPEGMETQFSSYLIRSEEDFDAFKIAFLNSFELNGIPFFQATSTRAGLWNSLSDDDRESQEYKEKKSAILGESG